MEKPDWFEDWFDTKFYHLLYRHRNDEEAQNFLDKLLNELQLHQGAHIQDLACGAGRHSIYLNSLGYRVTGLDLSKNSINEASESSNELLEFAVHDMREVYQVNSFDAILNLFTSFGYFQDEADNQRVIDSVYAGLKPGGVFVLDYLNSEKVITQLPCTEEKILEGYQFEIAKALVNGRIQKEISIQREGRSVSYIESVFPFTESSLKKLLTKSGLEVKKCFGNYSLEKYDPKNSERLILIAQKSA